MEDRLCWSCGEEVLPGDEVRLVPEQQVMRHIVGSVRVHLSCDMITRGRRLQAAYLTRLKAQGLVFRPMTDDELAVYRTGAPMPQFSHIGCDGGTPVVCEKEVATNVGSPNG